MTPGVAGGSSSLGSPKPGGPASDLQLSAMPTQAPAQKQPVPRPAAQAFSLEPAPAVKVRGTQLRLRWSLGFEAGWTAAGM